MLTALFISRFENFLTKSENILRYFNIIGGVFLIFLGILVITNYIGILSLFLLVPGEGMNIFGELSFIAAFVAGILTFLSPCILPLMPGFLSYITSVSEDK